MIPDCNYELPHCGARWPNRGPAAGQWTCTLDRGHSGEHMATGGASGPLYSCARQDDEEITWDR